jgi:DNA processing protein
LQMIDDAPPLIAVRGHLPALAMPAVAVVGSRNAGVAEYEHLHTDADDKSLR